MSFFSRQLGHVANHARLYRSYLARPAADRAIGEISAQAQGGEGTVLVEALWDHPHHWLRLALFRNALAPVFGRKLIGLYEQDASERVLASLRSLGLAGEETVPLATPDKYLRKAQELLAQACTPADILALEIAPGYPTHVFYDGVLKLDLTGAVAPKSPALPGYLARTLFYADFYQDLLERHDVRAVVVSHPTTLRFSTLVWAALKQGIPVFVINYRNTHVTVRRLSSLDEFRTVPEDTPSVADRDSLTDAQRAKLIEAGAAFLSAVYKGEKGEINVVKSFSGDARAVYERETLAKELGADPGKPNIVLMTSCWPDFPNAFGQSHFTDHVDWFEQTYAVARECPQYNWIFKPHPAEYMYGRNVSLRGLLEGRLTPNIFIWPEKAIAADVRSCADCTVTAVGSVGFEYPAFGARALVARETGYTAWGFSNYAQNSEEYATMLRRAAELPLPTQRQREDALIFIALRLSQSPETQANGYQYPWGRLSYNLWSGIPAFIAQHRDSLKREIEMMQKWLASGHSSYSVFKTLHSGEW